MNFSPTLIILFGLALRILVASWNSFFGPSPMAELDAQVMHEAASTIAQTGKINSFAVGTNFYTNFLGVAYHYTVDHLLVGSLLSCLAWYASAYIFLKSLLALQIQKQQIRTALLIYSLLPFSVLITSVTLREVYQLLFINLSMLSALLVFKKKKRHWCSLLLALFFAGSLHGVLTAFCVFFLVLTVWYTSTSSSNDRIAWVKTIPVGLVCTVILMSGMSFFGNVAYNFDDGITSAVEGYQVGALGQEGRANYKSELSITKPSDLFFFIPISFVQYLFEPFPWNVTVASDVILLIENALKAFFLLSIFKAVFFLKLKDRRLLTFITISFVVLELIWSVGTINWGTALRHHIPAWGLLLLSYFLARKLSNQAFTRTFPNKILRAEVVH